MFPSDQDLSEATRKWSMQITLPKTEQRTHMYQRNRSFTIVAASIDEALAKSRARFPGCEVWSASHAGQIIL